MIEARWIKSFNFFNNIISNIIFCISSCSSIITLYCLVTYLRVFLIPHNFWYRKLDTKAWYFDSLQLIFNTMLYSFCLHLFHHCFSTLFLVSCLVIPKLYYYLKWLICFRYLQKEIYLNDENRKTNEGHN